MAFLPSLGFLGFEIHIFYCNTPCLVWLPIQHRRKPISREPDFSVQKQGFLDGFLGTDGRRTNRVYVPVWPSNVERERDALLQARTIHCVNLADFFPPCRLRTLTLSLCSDGA